MAHRVGRVRDPIVGRDALVGVALGVSVALLILSTMVVAGDTAWPPTELLLGVRSVAGLIVMKALYAVRTALFFFFLLFLLRVLLRNQWVAALVFVLIFAVLGALESTNPLAAGATTFVYSTLLAFVVLRWGLTALAVGVLVADLVLMVPSTTDLSPWYLGATVLVVAIPIVIASWAFHTSVGGRLWKAEL